MTTPLQSPNLAGRALNQIPPMMTGPPTRADEQTPTIVVAWTLGVWLTCLLVGLCGIMVPYPHERLPTKELPPIVAETLQTELVKDEPAQPEPGPADATPDIPQPPPEPAAAPPAAPSLPPAALPSPEIALAVPVEGPTQIVAPKLARPMPAPAHPNAPSHSGAPSSSGAAAPSAVRHLTFGVGEGAQPSPDYPMAAVNAGEQGNVGVRFTVDESGKVVSTELASPSRWPLLNQSALRAIRERWRFAPGPRRQFDVVIQFQLNQQ